MSFAPKPLKSLHAGPESLPVRGLSLRTRHILPGLRSAAFGSALCAVLAATLTAHLPSQAAVLGDARVRSYLGQKLDAEIEVSALTAAESEALLVRIPAADAYAAAGIDLSALVRSLRLTLEKRGDQTFVRLSSDQPVNDPFLMMLVELNAGGTRTVRQYALLIDPAPLDRAQPVNVEPAIPEPESTPSDATNAESGTRAAADSSAGKPGAVNSSRYAATTTRRVRNSETLAAIGNELKPEGVRLEQVLVALQRANPQAFAGNNINRMKSGSVLSVPSADSMRALDANAARRIVIAQSADFQRYRAALAERLNMTAANAANADSAGAAPLAGNRSSSGAVGVQLKEPGAPAEPQDQLKLSAPAQAAANGKPEANAAATNGSNERKVLDQVAADKALADANARIAALEKNLSRMEQMLELRDRKLSDAQRAAEQAAKEAKDKAGAAPAQPSAQSPVPKPVAPPGASTAADPTGADTKADAKPDADRENAAVGPGAGKSTSTSTSTRPQVPALADRWTESLHNPLLRMIAAGVALIILLVLLLRLRTRRQHGKQVRKRGQVNLVGSATANASVTDAATRAAGADDKPAAASAGTVAATVGSAPLPPAAAGQPVLAAVKDASKGSGHAGSTEVDAIAEADVYIAYGRDEQAEEILRDALREQPQRHALRVKLLEIFAARRDRQGFGELAAALAEVTGTRGSEWEQAAQMGQLLDPGNPLYGGLSPAANAASAHTSVRPSAPTLQSVPATDKPGARSSAASPVDDFGLKLEGLLDEQRREQGRAAPGMQAPMQPPPTSAAPDFSLAGVGHRDTTSQRIEPTLEGEPEPATLNTKFDLALACEEIGDHDGARELLTEVAAARDPELSRRAQDMLRKLA